MLFRVGVTCRLKAETAEYVIRRSDGQEGWPGRHRLLYD
jgi:hypothetical protein